MIEGDGQKELTVGEILSYHKNEVGVICKYVTLHDLFQSQVNQQVQILDEKTKEISILSHAEDLANPIAAGAKKLGTAAKQQFLRPVDKLTGDRNNTVREHNSTVESQLDGSRQRDKPLKSEIGKNLNDNSNACEGKSEFEISAGQNTSELKLGSDVGNVDRQSHINDDLSTPLLLQDEEPGEADDLELNLSSTMMNKSMTNDGQNSRFMNRLKRIVMEGSKINKQKELQLMAEEILLQRQKSNVIEGSVLMPKDFSKGDESSTPRESNQSNL